MSIERRNHKRLGVSFDVRFEVGGIYYEGRMNDLSVGGCYIVSTAEVDLRSEINFEFRVHAERWLGARGLVMHHYPKRGFGVRFEFSSKAESELIERLVELLDRT